MNSLRWIPVAAVVLAAGCGTGGSYGGSPSPSASITPAPAPARAPALAVRKTSLGKVIVDSHGRTLYMFGADTKNVSNCSGDCATNWPPAAAPRKVKVGSGLSARKVRVIKRSDGSRQLSYAGHPVYRFVLDAKPGDVKGQGVNAFGGVWNVMAPSGKAVTSAPPKPQPQTSPGGYSGGGGY